ncbi:heterogeneous nuclear ribonucleoprotein H2 isoform X1 [Daphnia magna]|uniref:Heterogeneous nuclear ribonucleoprotein H n=1 Tax=Daphnia magna TaxID=35525 RepID=A0A0P5KNL7_9CRUS|nr:heterogeneous nuclear ribonucleoprotein H2 isoform X1 [Daphnia magna]
MSDAPEPKGKEMADEDGFVVRLRGLPWAVTDDDILKFFEDSNIVGGAAGIHMTYTREGRPTGEGYLELGCEEDVERALTKHNEHLGPRYIEVFRSKRSEMEWMVKRSGPPNAAAPSSDDDCFVRLRGLPFGCSKEEIAQFFTGLEIVPNGITLPTDYSGRSTGEAYIQFATSALAERALEKHKEKIGHRYIEIFRSSLSEARAALASIPRGGGGGGGRGGGSHEGRFGGGGDRYGGGRPSPYDRNVDRYGGGPGQMRHGGGHMRRREDPYMRGGDWGNGGGPPRYMEPSFERPRTLKTLYGDEGSGHRIHMRGLPFRASEDDIAEFFHPLHPVAIHIGYEQGRASGEADVEFATHEDAVRAMSRDKCNMQHRYIELFLNSTAGPAGYGPPYGGGYDN